jgi:hypothetical protein
VVLKGTAEGNRRRFKGDSKETMNNSKAERQDSSQKSGFKGVHPPIEDSGKEDPAGDTRW